MALDGKHERTGLKFQDTLGDRNGSGNGSGGSSGAGNGAAAGSGSSVATGSSMRGLTLSRRFTVDEKGEQIDPYATVRWEKRSSSIRGSDGAVVFEMDDVEVPADWSAVAGDIMASKYMRKAGVPQFDVNGRPILDEHGAQVTGPEKSTRQVVDRLVRCWRHWGEQHGYFASSADAEVFGDELAYMLLHQMAAPNSPQWFNTGLNLAYGLTGPAQGHYYVDPVSETVKQSKDAYSRPQPHACFIQSVTDDLVNAGGIMDLWVREARLFKYGSGTGTNFSCIRGEGEALAGGGFSSGLMSFLKIGDRAAGAIKSGGTTRRAAKMVCLDIDHPDVEGFINWKAEEERKVKALIDAGYPCDFNGEAYMTVSGQNSNNSVRVSRAFIDAVEAGRPWQLTNRIDGGVAKTVDAPDLWRQICEAAWRCADPGLQYDTTINEWHTCPKSGRINASNPCSEYMFLDDTACNLASINLVKFYDPLKREVDLDAFRHAVRLWTMVLEISVLMAQYPSQRIAELSYEYRTLGLGYANLGAMLMLRGIPYDSDEGRAIAGALTALMTGESYATSAEMARELGPFPRYELNRSDMLRVIRNHRRAAYNVPASEYEELSVKPLGIDSRFCPRDLLEAARGAWDRALALGEEHGFRNAQTTVIAPTGTIGLLMDCDTTGIEPDFALVKFKKLAGGGFFKIPNRSVEPALQALGYSDDDCQAIVEYLIGTNCLAGAPYVNRASLRENGLTDGELDQVDEALSKVFDLPSAFTSWVLGEECLKRLGFAPEQYQQPGFSLLHELGFSDEQIEAANAHICGRHTIEGAPRLTPEHLSVFDCANRCGKHGQRFIAPLGHLRMMSVAQPFISGAISKTINMPHETTVDEIGEAYMQSWHLGLKATALYRDGCKESQPLSTKSDADRGDSGEAKSAEGAAETSDSVSAVPELRQMRRLLPAKRRGFTQEARISGHKIYLRTGEYEDHTLGEIFVDMHKEGASFRALMNCFAIAVSKGLQYGVPLEEFVDTFTFTRFAPQGQVKDHPNIKMSTSVVDLVFRILALEYLDRTDFVHVKPPQLSEADPSEKEMAAKMQQRPTPESSATETPAPPPAEPAAGSTEAPPTTGQKASLAEALKSGGDDKLAAGRMEDFFMENYREELASLMGDAPTCNNCGQFTIRSGACYRCIFCGESQGCS